MADLFRHPRPAQRRNRTGCILGSGEDFRRHSHRSGTDPELHLPQIFRSVLQWTFCLSSEHCANGSCNGRHRSSVEPMTIDVR
jgi:hypothetical protein